MRTLTASELLDLWEQGQAESSARRALLLLAPASDETAEALARLTVGERDRRLLALRQSVFGPRIASVATCSKCGEALELSFDVSDLGVKSGPVADELSFDEGGYEIRFRLPDSLDLMAAAGARGQAEARALLLERCVLGALYRGDRVSAARLPESIVERISTMMAEADPQADIQLALECRACGNHWRASFDIESFFWAEINVWAARLLGEVHTLASAYGWSEQDILRMSAWRRECYLNLVNG